MLHTTGCSYDISPPMRPHSTSLYPLTKIKLGIQSAIKPSTLRRNASSMQSSCSTLILTRISYWIQTGVIQGWVAYSPRWTVPPGRDPFPSTAGPCPKLKVDTLSRARTSWHSYTRSSNSECTCMGVGYWYERTTLLFSGSKVSRSHLDSSHAGSNVLRNTTIRSSIGQG